MNLKSFMHFVIAAAIILVMEWSGVWVGLVAHPFWSAKAVYIGIAGGVVLSLVISLIAAKRGISQWLVVANVVVLMGLVGAITWYGKAEFVASYAENSFAGRVWFIGFMGFIATVFAALVELSRLIFRRPG